MTRTAVVTLTHRRDEHLAAQHRALGLGSRLPDDYVVVAMDDDVPAREVGGLSSRVLAVPRTPDGSLPLAAARNAGVAAALSRGADVVVLLDVDCLPGSDLVQAYTDVVCARPRWVWSGPVTYLPPPPREGYPSHPDQLLAWDDPHPARPRPAPGELRHALDPDLFWSLSFALHRDAWRQVGGFCEDYRGYGAEDTDFARSAITHGVGLGTVGAARAYHQHHPVGSPPVEHLDDILRNGRLFHARWGEWPMTGWLEEMARAGLVARAGEHWVRVRTRHEEVR